MFVAICIIVSLLILSDGADEAAVRLFPFTVQLRSKSKPEKGNYLVRLRNILEGHLRQNTIELLPSGTYGEGFIDVELFLAHFTLNEDDDVKNRNLRRDSQASTEYVLTAHFEGLVHFQSHAIPDEDVMYDIQLQAFSGNLRIDLLNEIQSSGDAFFAAAHELQTFFGAIQAARPTGKENGLGSLPLLPMAIGVVVGIILIAIGSYAFYLRKRDGPTNLLREPQETRSKTQHHHGNLEISSTRSLSPLRSIRSTDSSKFTYNEAATAFKSGSGKSTISGDSTINFSMNVDAWKNAGKTANHEVPFSGDDISIIHRNSPKKPVVLQSTDGRRMKEQRQLFHVEVSAGVSETEGPSSLSKESLSNFSNSTKSKRNSVKYHANAGKPIAATSCRRLSQREGGVINDLKNLSLQINEYRTAT